MTTAHPSNPLAAKAGRLYVIRVPFDLYVGHNWDDHKPLPGITAQSPRHARKFSTMGDAEAWRAEVPYRGKDFATVQPYDPPDSVEAELEAMHERERDRERVKWVAGGANGHAVEVGA